MNYQEILLVINFIILFYIIYKINCLENDKIETFDATTDAAIRQAVNQVYTVDVDAIRSLSKFAIALTQGGMTVPGDLTIAGSIKDNRIDFGYNDTSREANAGKIEYGTFDPTALCIVGKGVPNTRRKVKIWDDVIVGDDLSVGGGLKVNNNISTDKDIIVASGKNIYTDSIGNENELKIYSKQGARISKGWEGNGNLAVEGDVNTNGNIYLAGDNKVISAKGRLHLSCDEWVHILSKGGKTVISKAWGGNADLQVEGNLYVDNVLTADKNYTVLKGGSNGNTNNEATFFGHPDGKNYIRGDTRFDRGKIIVGASHNGVSNTISEGTWDPDALCIVGKGVDGVVRKVRLWDDVQVDRNLIVNGNTTTSTLNVNGILKVSTIQPDERLHLSSSTGDVYLLAKGNSVVSKAWGGSGNLYVDGELNVPEIVLGNFRIWTEGNKLFIGKNDKNKDRGIAINLDMDGDARLTNAAGNRWYT